VKVIFLDIDGVLNNELYLKEQYKTFSAKEMEKHPSNYISNDNIIQLNSLCDRTDASIVISSSWRKMLSLDEIKTALLEKGFAYQDRIIGITPELGSSTRVIDRGSEIKEWLKTNAVDKFVIIDDGDDMGNLFSYLIKTDYIFGLQEKHVFAALFILNKE